MKRLLKRAGAAAALALLLGAVWTLLVGPRRLVVHREALALARWPADAPSLRVALVSDLHVGSPHWSPARVRMLVERVNEERPDLILLAGDYVIDGVPFGTKVDPETAAGALAGFRAPCGTLAVLGNHDVWNDGARVRRALEAHGIVVLENELRVVEHRGARVAIAGLADEMTRVPLPRETFDAAPPGVPLIALVHEPDVFPAVDERPAVTFAGHTHGGQVALPLVGRLIVPSRYGERYAAGHVVEGARHLFVTTGVGTSVLPVRFGVPPEIAILTLAPGP